MKISIIAIILLAIGSVGLQAQTPTTTATQGNVPAPTDYQIVQQDGNSRVWQREIYEQEPNGQIVARPHKFTELATGLNYKDSSTGQWQPSKEEIDIQPDGTLAATQGQHQVYFPGNIYGGEIELVQPNGVQLHSCPVGLSYDDGSNTVLIAVLTNSIGQLVGSNQVIYTNAFVGLDADLLYNYTKAGLEQDVVIRAQPPTPASLGLNPDTTRLQVLTEFFDPPRPGQTTSTLPEQAGLALTDDTLDFGTMQMIPGKAFMLGDDSPSAQVGKSWVNVDGRQLLVEAVPVSALAEQLDNLPAPTAQTASTAKARAISRNLILPPQHLAKAGVQPLKLARAGISRKPGVVLDYLTVNSSLTNYTFQGDTTYYISGTTYSYGTNIFEGGTVIKYASSGEIYIQPHPGTTPSVTFEASAYRPVVFTAKDDNSVGDAISGSTGSPSGYYGTMLNIAGFSLAGALTDFRMAYADTGISCSGVNANFYNAQFMYCQNPFDFAGATVGLRNALFSNNATNFAFGGGASVNAQNVTFNGASCLAIGPTSPEGVTLTLTNCILSSESRLTNGYVVLAGDYNGFYNTQEFGTDTTTNTVYPFQTVGGGKYYLTNSCDFHNSGTTNIDPALLANLAVKTTYPPIAFTNVIFPIATNFVPQAMRDNAGNPDLGYHYDPIDYSFGGCFADANFTFTNGTAVGWFRTSSGWEHAGYGIDMGAGVTVLFSGTATAPDYWVRLNTVQEQDHTAGYGQAGIETWVNSDLPTVSGQFLRCSAMAGELRSYFSDDYGSIQARMVNSEFWGGTLDAYGDYMYFTNCLMQRVDMELWNGSAGDTRVTWDCTFFGGEYYIERTSGGSAFVSVRNSSFDGTSISTSDYYGSNPTYSDYNYNAYTNSTDPFSIGGANDVTGVSFSWESSWFGNYYLPSDSALLEKGSMNANMLGLYYFTTQTNQTIEGDSLVDIGYHYVATDQYGNPLATFGDGIPNYLDDPNGNGLPNWWEMEYFGNTDESATNLDGLGNTLLYDYQNNLYPNVIGFWINATNNYLNTSSATVQLNVFGGVPDSVAVSVDDTNYANDAVWTTFNGTNINLNLGTSQGWHNIWIGLKGVATNATVTWQWKRLKLDFTPPTLIITNPVVTTVSVPLVQIQGYSPEEIASITYDLTNALGFVTNQEAGITDQIYSTNTFEYTTNYFECTDVPLTNGINIITLHATDMSGNTTTTNISITLDYSSRTNPPTVDLYWPQNDAFICNTNYTWRGWVDDPTATVTAQMVDTNGDTNDFSAIVERNGDFWVEGIPVSSGTNYLTLLVTDSAGNTMTTNITVFPSGLGLTITMPDSSELWSQGITVNGTINDSSDYTVWVNGTEAALNGDGTWTVTNVYMPDGGTALLEARAIPNTDNGGNGIGGSGGGSVAYNNLGNPSSPEEIDAEVQGNKPARLYVQVESSNEGWKQTRHYWVPDGSDWDIWNTTNVNNYTWTDGETSSALGTVTADIESSDGDSPFYDENTAITWPASSYPTLSSPEIVITGNSPGSAGNTQSPFFMGHFINYQNQWTIPPYPLSVGLETVDESWNFHANTTMKLQTGGKSGSNRQNLFCLSCTATKYEPTIQDGIDAIYEWDNEGNIPGPSIQIDGKAVGSDGNLWRAYADNDVRDVTPLVASADYYHFIENMQEYTMTLTANDNDIEDTTPVFLVGQQVNFAPSWIPSAPPATETVSLWNLPQLYVNQQYQYSLVCSSYEINPNLLFNNTTSCWFVDGRGGAVTLGQNLEFANGQQVEITAKGNITVYKPQATWNGYDTGVIAVDSNYVFPGISLHFGNPNGVPGFTALLIVSLSDWSRGTYSAIQLGSSTSYEHCNVNGLSIHGTSAGLDGMITLANAQVIGPYKESPYSDSPGVPSYVGDYQLSDSGAFQTYLMFQPPLPSIAVPLKLIGWNWSGVGTVNASGNWTLNSFSDPPPSPNNQNTTSFPVWSNVIGPWPAGYTIITNNACE